MVTMPGRLIPKMEGEWQYYDKELENSNISFPKQIGS